MIVWLRATASFNGLIPCLTAHELGSETHGKFTSTPEQTLTVQNSNHFAIQITI